ncbi:MAG: amidohydrolase family protein [Ignavibacteriaceae bacterium]
MKRFKTILLFSPALLFLLVVCNENPDPTSSNNNVKGTFAITNAFLIDGSGSNPIPNSIVIIHDGLIQSVGTNSSLDIPSGVEIIDLQGSYILPGLMNTHVHSGYVENNLKEWANSGVTTVRDIGNLSSSPAAGFSTRNSLLIDNKNARLVAAGPLVTTVGGYGNYPVASPFDAQLKTNGLISAGADLIKIAIEDNLQGRNWPMLSMDEIKMICQTAHNRNKRVAAHISRAAHLYMAIKGEVDDVDHMVIDTLPDSLITLMIQKDIYWVPTLELWAGVSDMFSINWIEIAKSNLHRFVQAGGKVALGTDYDGYVTPFDLGMPITEMKLMQEAGMTPMQIIIAGTINAASVCDLENDLGTIEAGKIADIIIVKDNPLEDLESFLNVQMVIHNGEIIMD